MIEVKMYLYDSTEIALMAQFEAILTQKRNTPPEIAPPQGAQGGESSIVSPVGVARSIIDAPEAPDVQGAAHLPVPAPVEVDDVTVQRTITTYGQQHGVPATIARMQELFGVSKASLVPSERRAEFVGAFAV